MSKLITYQYLIKETDISQTVDQVQLDNPIKWAHDQLRFILGRSFYDEIASQASTNPTTFDTNNAALFDPYIKQFLAWTAYHDYISKANAIVKRTGVRVFKEDDSDPASDQMMNNLIKTSASKAQFYKGEMVNYILELQEISASNFPLYEPDCNNAKFGTGFGISGVSRISTSQKDLTQRKIQNGY